jgi:formylglycine-generating enzyme required for sulfatase activity
MHGNVWEWCLDSWGGGDDTYRDGITDPLAQGGPQRVGRGGSWNNSPAGCRSADRNASDPSGACANLGFRPVLAPRSGGRPSSARRQLDEGN